jgi:hypothetical protein
MQEGFGKTGAEGTRKRGMPITAQLRAGLRWRVNSQSNVVCTGDMECLAMGSAPAARSGGRSREMRAQGDDRKSLQTRHHPAGIAKVGTVNCEISAPECRSEHQGRVAAAIGSQGPSGSSGPIARSIWKVSLTDQMKTNGRGVNLPISRGVAAGRELGEIPSAGRAARGARPEQLKSAWRIAGQTLLPQFVSDSIKKCLPGWRVSRWCGAKIELRVRQIRQRVHSWIGKSTRMLGGCGWRRMKRRMVFKHIPSQHGFSRLFDPTIDQNRDFPPQVCRFVEPGQLITLQKRLRSGSEIFDGWCDPSQGHSLSSFRGPIRTGRRNHNAGGTYNAY